MSRIFFTTQAEAQAFADKTHQWLIANNPAYAKSVREGHTKRWAIPARDLDKNDQPIGDWYVRVKERCDGSLTTTERTKLQPDGTKEVTLDTRTK